LVSQVYSRHLRSQWHEVVKLESSALSVVQEVLAAVRVVKAFGQEDREQERYVRHANQGVWARFRAILTEGGVRLLLGLISALGSAIAFRNVSFAYDGKSPVLHDISFEIGPGTSVGIAGTTGAGKTTLVSLLTRFYDPTAGQVLLDGSDLRDYKLADLRNQFAIVLQEPVLFSTSIAENIAYARPGASDREIIEAAKAANAHQFVVGLPQGYETLVGERGMRLSGGERQRIALARAFLKDAPILILDEPTSSVDTKTEATVLEAMGRLMQGRTTLIIAHRPSA